MKIKMVALALISTLFSCSNKQQESISLLKTADFETEINGEKVSLYTLKSGNGITMQVTNYGARVVALWVPDKSGKVEDIVLGYSTIEQYINNKGERFLGSAVGPVANRIGKGQFDIDGIHYQLPLNSNGQTLHGGINGIVRVVWTVDNVTENELSLSYISPDGQDGFPGNLAIKMKYVLTPENEFKITYEATTDKTTVVNLSHHSFFNLKGEGNGTILDHILTIKASHITPVNSDLIPTGEITSVEGTPFDFRTPTVIGERINEENAQLENGKGYDQNWVIDRRTENEVELVASLYEPKSGRFLEILTDQPALQFYSGNFFDGTTNGKSGKLLNFREAVALETQKYPDSPNHANFPSTLLKPGEIYTQTCIYKFSIK
jgi:aldose 1-epimerase